MTKLIWAGAAALLVTSAALAEPVITTYTVSNDNVSGTKTVTRDKEAGTVSKDSELTRLSDGAVATREYDRQRTESGWIASGSTTRFNGDTRSWDYQRTRTAHGYNADGSLTRFNGQSYDYSAKVRRGGERVARSQVLRNDQGQVVAAKRTVRPRRGH